MKFVSLAHRTYKKLGNQVMYNLFGSTIARAYVPKFNNPRTSGQITVRNKFSLLTKLAFEFSPALALGYKAKALGEKMYPRNMFISRNYSKVTGTEDAVTVDVSQLEIASGPVANVFWSSTIDVTTPEKIKVTVSDANLAAPNADANDKIYVYVYSTDLGMGILSSPVARTVGASVTVTVPASWTGLDVHVYSFVIGGSAAYLGESSPSIHIGHAEVG